MFGKISAAALALMVLAGCGHAPMAVVVRPGAATQALVDTSKHRHALTVPSSVMDIARDYMARTHKQYDQGDTTVHFTATVVASNDNFRTKFTAAIEKVESTKGDETVMLDEDAPTGAVSYYVMVGGTTVATNGHYVAVNEIPDFYVSDYGKNYRATLK